MKAIESFESERVVVRLSYEERIRKIFKYAYVVREENTYTGPVWFKYAIFCGPNRYCRENVLLGLGNTEEKAWLDAFYGFKFLKVNLGIEEAKGSENVTSRTLIKEDNEKIVRVAEKAIVKEIKIRNVGILDDKKQIGIEIKEEINIDISLGIVARKVKRKVRCESFVKNPRDRRRWIQCDGASIVRVEIIHSGIENTSICLCKECLEISNNGKVELKLIESFEF